LRLAVLFQPPPATTLMPALTTFDGSVPDEGSAASVCSS
jgi:hypothetical protein